MADETTTAHDEGRKTNRRRAVAGYRWGSRLNWLNSLFRTPSEAVLGIASAGVVGTVAVMTATDAVESAQNRKWQPAPIETTRQTQNSTVFEIIGFDKAGRRGVFDVVVLNKEFKWVHASSEELERDGKRIPAAQIATEVLDSDVRASLAEAKEIVAIGTASQEGQAANEVERARKRALKTAEFAKETTFDWVPLWALNLGQYRDPCAACETVGTSWQRPFIVVAVKELEDGAVLGEALADAMTGKDQLPSPASYSAYEISRIR